MLRWVVGFLLVGAVAVALNWYEVDSGPAVWALMALCVGMLARLAMLALSEGSPPSPTAPTRS